MDRRARIADVLLALALAAPPPALAQTWSGAAGSNWSVGGNWVGGVAPANATGTSVVFPVGATTFTPFIDVPYTVTSLAYTGPGYTISGGNLLFDGVSPVLSVSAPGNTMAALNTIITNLTLTATSPFTHLGGFGGPGPLTIAGPGAVTISGGSLQSGTLTTTANAIVNIGDGSTGPGLVNDVVNDGALNFATPAITMIGTLTGNGSLAVTFPGFVTKGSATPFQHAGPTTMDGILQSNSGPAISNNARLTINAPGILITVGGTVGSLAGGSGGSLTLNAGGVFTAGGDNTSTTFSGSMGGNGDFVKTGSGAIAFTGPTWTSGTATVQAPGSMNIGQAGAGPNFVGALVADGALGFGAGTTVTGPLTGSGTVAVDNGAFVVNNSIAPFTHTGTTTLNGSLQSSFIPAIVNAAPLFLNFPGILDTVGGSVGSLQGDGRLTISAGTFTTGVNGTSTTFSGLFGGIGNFVKTGAGTLTIATTSWPGGTTTVEAPGTLLIGSGGAGPGLVGPLVANGTLVFNKNGSISTSGSLTGTGSVSVASTAQVINTSPVPFTHAGQTTIDGRLFRPGAPAIVNNAPLVINAPTGQLQTGGGMVGSLAGSGLLTLDPGTFTAGGDGTSTTYTGTLGGLGDFTKAGAGTLTMAPSGWFGGLVTVQAPGTLRIGNGSFGPSSVGPIVADGSLVFDLPFVTVAGMVTGAGTVSITPTSVVALTAASSFTHAGSTIVDGSLNAPGSPAIVNSAPLVINAPGFVATRGGAVGSLAGNGMLNVTLAPFTVGSDNTSTVFSGNINAPTSATFTKAGTGTLSLTGTSFAFSAPIDVIGGTLALNGVVASPVTVASGGTLAGSGGTSGAVTINAGGTIAPGNTGPGVLPTGNLTLAGTFQAQIPGGGPAGVGFDQIGVAGTVTLNSPTLVLSGASVPVAGLPIRLIQNDGADPVVGTFNGLPEGTVFTFNGVPTQITYVGGTGNDVELSLARFVVTSSAGPNGSITPLGPQPSIFFGQQRVFSVTPAAGYAASVGGTCTGNLVGTTYTTNPVTADCTVVATFTQITFTVTPSAGPNGTIAPPTPQTIAQGATTSFVVTPATGYTPSVGGSCGGTLVANTYTTAAITANCTVVASFTLNTYTVTPSAGANGSITPATPQTVNHGATTTFTVTPAAGYFAAVGGTCPAGALVGTTYTTGAITAACTVVASFTQVTFTVTPSAGANGTIAPNTPQTVAQGATRTFTVTPAAGYTASVGGTCGGSLAGTTYTTNAITANCTVVASFTQVTFTVTPSAGANGTIAPSTPQTIAQGATTTFTVAPSAGYTASVGGTCNGTLAGTTYTTNAITANCTVAATFTSGAVTTFTGPTATGTGNATASFTGGGATCSFVNPRFIPVSGDPASPPAGTAPAMFAHGLFTFTLNNCTPGSTVTMTIAYPAALAPGTQYWKYGPEPGNAAPHWYVMPAAFAGATVVFSITDGAQGDDDLAANGTIVDQGGPGVPPGGGPIPTPTLSQWMLMVLASLLLLMGMRKAGPGATRRRNVR